jgi:hypothetical protein
VDKLPLADIIALNLDHYRLNADYKHGLHFTALPTAWVSGFDKTATLRIGSSTAWVSETPGATAGFLEFTGQGLTTFERAMDRDERLMAILGSRMLEGQKMVGETAEAIELRQSGESSVLMTLALSVSDSVRNATVPAMSVFSRLSLASVSSSSGAFNRLPVRRVSVRKNRCLVLSDGFSCPRWLWALSAR